MKTTRKRNIPVSLRKRLKWTVRNNIAFFIVIGIICLVIGYIFGVEALNYRRIKRMETVLGKRFKIIHRRTGLTDHDVEKLRQEDPNFNWEGTWDRTRWKTGIEENRKAKSTHRAKEPYNIRESKKRYELKKTQRVPSREWQ